MYHDPDFHILQHILPVKPFVVDVGANKGQSIRSIKFARPNSIIHSFEPNPEFKETLSALTNEYQDVFIKNYGLGRCSATMDFYIPVINGMRYLEEATMRLESLSEPWVVQRFKVRGDKIDYEIFSAPIMKGDDFNFNPDLIKIDVEGVESEVVAGFYETIQKASPILFIENGDWHRLRPLIDQLGYAAFMPDSDFRELIPFSGTRTNTFYLKLK
jgi:FkbM family methyltransferase